MKTDVKSINNQKCQEIKLHGTSKTKELKKQSTRPTRPVRREEGENPRQGSRPRRWGWLREPVVKWRTVQEELAEQKTEIQSWLWIMVGVAAVRETPSLTWGFVRKTNNPLRARAKQESFIVPPLAPAPQTVLQCSEEGCPVLVST